jgi:[ribosomal protein S18]-alanine N-acetyltransferase
MPWYCRIKGVPGSGAPGAGVEGSDDIGVSHYPAIVHVVFLETRDTIVFIVTVRVFEKSDLPGILRIERESFDRDAWPRELFLEYAAAVPDLFLVARVGGRIAGYSIGCLTRHGGEIASLGVRPVHRQRGVATALLRAMLRKLRRMGAQAVWLTVRRRNEAAIHLYRKLGFMRTSTVPNYYKNSSGWRMKMELS